MNLTNTSVHSKFARWLGAAFVLLGAILIGEAIGVFSQNIFWGFLAGLAGILFLALAI